MGPKTESFDERLRELFGTDARSEGPLAASGAGRRFTGIDLCHPPNTAQVALLLDALCQFRSVSIAGQDLKAFSLAYQPLGRTDARPQQLHAPGDVTLWDNCVNHRPLKETACP